MTLVAEARMTLDEFLALPEEKPYKEYVCGRVYEKPMPNKKHSRMVIRLARLVDEYLEQTGEGDADTELRHVHRGEGRTFLPDVSVTLAGRLPPIEQNPVEVMPDLVIEVLSPDDRPGRVLDKLAFYQRIGIPLVWVIDPEDEYAAVYRPGSETEIVRSPEVIDARPVLRGFTLDLGELFAVLHPEREAAS